MAWTTLTFAFGSVLTSAKMTQLYDNLTAVAQGLSGSPKVLDAAFSTNSINGNKIVSNSISGAQLASNSVSSVELANNSVAFGSEIAVAGSNSSVSVTTSYQTFTGTGLYTFGSLPGNASSVNELYFEIWNGATWVRYVYDAQSGEEFDLTVVSTGANVRYRQLSGANQNLTYRNHYV